MRVHLSNTTTCVCTYRTESGKATEKRTWANKKQQEQGRSNPRDDEIVTAPHLRVRGGRVNDRHATVLEGGPPDVRHKVSGAAGPDSHRRAPGHLVVPVDHLKITAILDQRVVL